MIDELKSDRLVKKIGGRFRLTALVQKRLGELLQGARPLIDDVQNKTMLEIVVQEILQDKITAEGSPLDNKPRNGYVGPGGRD